MKEIKKEILPAKKKTKQTIYIAQSENGITCLGNSKRNQKEKKMASNDSNFQSFACSQTNPIYSKLPKHPLCLLKQEL